MNPEHAGVPVVHKRVGTNPFDQDQCINGRNECHNQSGYYRSPFRRRSLPIGSKFMVQVLRTDSHCPLQRTILMEASPPPSDGTLYVWVLQLERGGFTGCSSGPTVDGS